MRTNPDIGLLIRSVARRQRTCWNLRVFGACGLQSVTITDAKGNNVYLLTFSVFFVILYTILSKCRLNATSSVGVNIDALLEEALSLTLDNILCDTSSSNQKLRDTVKLCRV